MALGALVSLCLFLVSSRAASPFCSNPGLPSNGHVIATDYRTASPGRYAVGDKILFECNDGHRLVGNRSLKCLQIGQGIAKWSNKVPLCEQSRRRTAREAAAACSKPKDITNGVVSLTRGLAVRSVARYSCSEGFELSTYGSSSRICLTQGRGWSGTPPSCRKLAYQITSTDCAGLSSRLTNGHVTIRKIRHRLQIATYSCNSGYTRNGPSVRVCSSRTRGKWSGRLTSCRATGTCPKLYGPRNGNVAVTNGLLLGSKATYSCDSGFEKTSDQERTCQTNGHWSAGYPPICRKNCEMLLSPPNGNVYVKGLVVGSYAMYSCHVGYKLEGKTRRCQYGGTWTEAQPICKRICGDLSAPNDGSVDVTGLRAEYSCDDGFELVGNKIVTCLNIGRWTGKKPICRIRPKKCQMPPAPSNGQVNVDEKLTVGSKAMYSCDSGFDLVGSQLRECLIDEKWSDKDPYCKPEVKTCGKLNDPSDGKVVLRDAQLVTGSEAEYYCKRGFVLEGDRKLLCQANGKWAGQVPTCKFVRCRKPRRPKHGRVRANGNVLGSRARYSCRPRYVISRRHRVRKCQGNGKWSGRTPSCVLIVKDGFRRIGNLFGL